MSDPATDVPDDAPTGFADLGLRPELLDALTTLGYEEPTPIQRAAIPVLRSGRDVLGQAATGTGKTAAFALPILDRQPPTTGDRTRPRPHALVLVPTRELAVQVSEAVWRYGRGLGTEVLPIYGGQPIGRQLAALNRGVHVVVATPGRALDHIGRGTLPLDAVEVVVLDEADEMLDMGFAEDIEEILGAIPSEHQTVLLSATLPPRIAAIARRHLRDPERITIGHTARTSGASPLVDERTYVVPRSHKAAALGRVLDVEAPGAAIVFCRTRTEVDQLTETLNGRGYRAEALHGGMSQEQRDRVMGRLRSETADLLVATDVAARGLDVDHLTHVVNYDVPSAPDAYVHRIGRVGRAGREGVAITLAEPREQRLVANIERATGRRIRVEKVPTVADLRARQMEITVSTVREALDAKDLDRFRVVVDTLASEVDLEAVALAAVKLVHEATGAAPDEEEIPEASLGPRRRPDRDGGRSRTGGDRDRGERAQRGAPGDGPAAGKARIYVGLGRSAGMRPGDLVGAIANETGLAGRDIGPIRITERFSLVDVPAGQADRVIDALRSSTIRGRRTSVRRDRDVSSGR